MAVIRHEEQEFALIADLVNSTTPPSANDAVYVIENNRLYRWEVGNSLPSDNIFIIEQTSESANGRWISENESYIHNAYVETDYLPNQFDISQKTIDIPNLSKTYVSSVILRNADDVSRPNRFTGKSDGDNKVSIEFQNLSNQAMFPQTLHIGIKMVRDKDWNANTGNLQKVFLIGSEDSPGLIYSADNLATFKTLNIPELTNLTNIWEITHDVSKREIYVIGGSGFTLATNNTVIGKITGVRLDASDNLVYDSALEFVHGDNIRVVSDIKSYGQYLYVIEQFPLNQTNTKLHRLNKSDLQIVNSVDINNQQIFDLVVNENGVYAVTGRGPSTTVNLVRFNLDLSNKTSTQLSVIVSKAPMVTALGSILYIVTINNTTFLQGNLHVFEYDTETNTLLRTAFPIITDFGNIDFYSMESDGEKLYISSYDTGIFPDVSTARMLILNISDFSLVSENVNGHLLGDDSVYDFKNERVAFTAPSGINKGSIFTYDKATQAETIIPINSETLNALDYLFIPKTN